MSLNGSPRSGGWTNVGRSIAPDRVRNDVASYLRDYPELTRIGWVEPRSARRIAVFRRQPGARSEVEPEAHDAALGLADTMAERVIVP